MLSKELEVRKNLKTYFAIIVRYGLILPQKKGASKNVVLQKPSVFGDDSDDEVR